MNSHLRVLGLMIAAAALAAGTAAAQQRGTPPPPAEAATQAAQATLTPLKVTVILSKYQGQKQVSHLPYTLVVNANDRKPANVHTAIQVLIPMITVEGKTVGPVYKDVGTKIECSATSLDGGRFRLEIEIEDSSVFGEDQPSAGAPRTTQPSWLKSFRSTQMLILRDGQTMQYTSATDKTNGEEVKVEVSLAVVK